MQIISYGDYVFADHDWHAGLTYDASRSTWFIENRITPRTGNTSITTPGTISPLRLAVDITLEPNSALELLDAMDALIGALNPRDQEPKLLVADRNGVTVERMVRISDPAGWTMSRSAHSVQVIFISEDPEWTEQTPVTEDQTGTASPFELAFTNAGQATVYPRYRLRWETQRTTFGTTVGQRYRKRMTLTNTQDITLGPFPYMINLGDTAALVSGSKAQSDGDDLIVVIHGLSVDRELNGWNRTQSFAWVVIPGMDAGEVLTIDVLYGNTSATSPSEWGELDPERPVINLNAESGTATGGSTTTLVRTGAGWQTDEWRWGLLYMLTGTLAGEVHTVTTNSSDTLTTATFSATIDSGDTYLVINSANDRWSYAVRQTQRDVDDHRGRFYVNARGLRPTVVSYEAPGSWQPALVADNRDSYGQKRYSWINNGTDEDTYALLDVERMWEGNDKRVPEAGSADGLSLSSPYPITEVYWEYQIDNPNGMVKMFVGVRDSGAEDWVEAAAYETATSGLTTLSTNTNPLDLSTFDDPHHIVMALLPVDDVEIDLDWRRDEGSATSGTTTTMTDSNKEWATDQFDNGSIRMLSGDNAGRKRAITSNTSTTITHAAFPSAIDDGDRYVLRNKRLKGILRDGSRLIVLMDTSVLTNSGLGAEVEVYEMSCSLWIGDGPSGDPEYQHRAVIGWHADNIDHRIFLAADEELEIDAASGRIRIWDTSDEEYTSELTDPAVQVLWHNGTEWVRSGTWLPIGQGAQSVWVSDSQIGELGVEVVYNPAYLGP